MPIVGAGIGNMVSDFMGGVAAGNAALAIGTGLGCLIDCSSFRPLCNSLSQRRQTMAEKLKTLTLTPTWSDVVPIIVAGLQDGNAEGQRMARQELDRMAASLTNRLRHCAKLHFQFGWMGKK